MVACLNLGEIRRTLATLLKTMGVMRFYSVSFYSLMRPPKTIKNQHETFNGTLRMCSTTVLDFNLVPRVILVPSQNIKRDLHPIKCRHKPQSLSPNNVVFVLQRTLMVSKADKSAYRFDIIHEMIF